MGSGWGAGAKTLRIATLSLVYSTAEYCAPVWCRSTHTRLIDNVLNDALSIVTGCLCPTPTDHLPVLSGIQPAELRRLGATLSLAYRGSLDTDHILHGLLSGSSDTGQVRLRFRSPFVPDARNLLDNLARLGIRASEWTNHKWNAKYCESASRLRAFSRLNNSDNKVAVKQCNCRSNKNCSLNGKCCRKSTVYKASLKTGESNKFYYGSCETSFKL